MRIHYRASSRGLVVLFPCFLYAFSKCSPFVGDCYWLVIALLPQQPAAQTVLRRRWCSQLAGGTMKLYSWRMLWYPYVIGWSLKVGSKLRRVRSIVESMPRTQRRRCRQRYSSYHRAPPTVAQAVRGFLGFPLLSPAATATRLRHRYISVLALLSSGSRFPGAPTKYRIRL